MSDTFGGVLGLNRRNWLIARYNPRFAIHSVNDKFRTKERLAEHGVPVPQTLALLENREQLTEFDLDRLPEAWAMKPNHGRRGEGILLISGRDESGWKTVSGMELSRERIIAHASHILDGEHSLDGAHSDSAIVEPLIRTHPVLARIVHYGLPDVRIICFGPVPLMAMVRLPTNASGGKANLHQGAIGAAVNFKSGKIFRAVLHGESIARHPDTGIELVGKELPLWDEIVDAASRCAGALKLGYVGVDAVLDDEKGVMVLECNAHPGIEIQNINAQGLWPRVKAAQRYLDELGEAPERYRFKVRKNLRTRLHNRFE